MMSRQTRSIRPARLSKGSRLGSEQPVTPRHGWPVHQGQETPLVDRQPRLACQSNISEWCPSFGGRGSRRAVFLGSAGASPSKNRSLALQNQVHTTFLRAFAVSRLPPRKRQTHRRSYHANRR